MQPYREGVSDPEGAPSPVPGGATPTSPPPTAGDGWVPDILPGFEQLTLELGPDEEGEVVATLVRRAAPGGEGGAAHEGGSAGGRERADGIGAEDEGGAVDAGVDVLYVHGWNDYFFQTHVADFWERHGARFYALDLRKYGRSIREHQTPGFIRHLSTYDEDIDAALDAMGHPAPAPRSVSTVGSVPPERSGGGPAAGMSVAGVLPAGGLAAAAVRALFPDAFAGPTAGAGPAPAVPPAPGAPSGDPARSTDDPQEVSRTPSPDGHAPRAALVHRGETPDDAERMEPDPGRRKLLLVGHSTGGLVLSLWVSRRPGRADGLVLNSPWLEFQTRNIARRMLEPGVRMHAALAPQTRMVNLDLGLYTRSISSRFDGEWDYDPTLRSDSGWSPTPAWLAAILQGHEAVSRGLGITVPVLVLLSSASSLPVLWSEASTHTDTVLDVVGVARRAADLGSHVTIVRIEGALHDVTLSAAPVREVVRRETERWFAAYMGPQSGQDRNREG